MAGRSRLALLHLALGLLAPAARADDPRPDGPPAGRLAPAEFALPGETPPAAFVPKTPRTVADEKKLNATRLYVEARALEDHRQFTRAVLTLEKALESDPSSVPVLRRLSLLCAATGKIDQSIDYGRRAVASDPTDAATIARLVDLYRRREPDKAEPFLKEVLANPKLDKNSSEALVLEFELAQLYEATGRFDRAADALAKVVEAIDTKVGNRLNPADQRRILGEEEASAYVKFGGLFLKANRKDLALRCFRRAEVYDDQSPQIPLMVAIVLLESNQPAEALQQVEKAIARQHQGREAFDVLSQVLKKLGREAEILPRLEAAAKADPQNIALQYALADRYREAGQVARADELLKNLIEVQPDLKGFAALYSSLLKDRKTEELLRLLTKATERLRRDDALDPQVSAIVADPEYAGKVIDTGLAMLSSQPPRLDRAGWIILLKIATRAKRGDKIVDLYRWGVKEFPSPQAHRELIDALVKEKRFDEAEAEFDTLLNRYPEERNPETQVFRAQIRLIAHREDAAIELLREVLKTAPNDAFATRLLALALGQKGQVAEAVALLKEALRNDPANVDLMRMVAAVYQQAGKNEEMIAYLKSVLERFPNNDEVAKFARSNLSIGYSNLGDYAKSEAELEILFAKEPEDPGVNNDLGYLYVEQGKNLEKAEGMIRKAVSDEPENPAYLDSLGWVLFKRGKAKEAVEPLKKAIEHLDREDATIPEHLGDVYFEIKDRGKARELWEKAEKVAAGMTPPDKRLPEIRKKLESLKKLESSPQPASSNNP